MADLELRQRDSAYDEKLGEDSVEKASVDSSGKPVDDAEMVKEVEAMEDRIQHDEATDDEYRVREAWEVAIKVRSMLPDRPSYSHAAPRRSCRRAMTPSCRRSHSARSSLVLGSLPSARK